MTIKQIESIKAFVAVVLSALVASKALTPDLSNTVTGILAAALAVYASFRVIPPQKIQYEEEPVEEFEEAVVDPEWSDGSA
jgi:hypothetical protein